MTKRTYGDGGLHWDERRQRWIATVTLGYDGRGKRVVKRRIEPDQDRSQEQAQRPSTGSGDGLTSAGRDGYTVAQAIEDWLAYGLVKQGPATIAKLRSLSDRHVLPFLGSRKLGELTAGEVMPGLQTVPAF